MIPGAVAQVTLRLISIWAVDQALGVLQTALTPDSGHPTTSATSHVVLQRVLQLLEDAAPDPTQDSESFDSYLQLSARFLANLLPTGTITISSKKEQTSEDTRQLRRAMRHLAHSDDDTLDSQQASLTRASATPVTNQHTVLDFQRAGGSRV